MKYSDYQVIVEKEYLLREKPLRAIWLFALPMMAGNLFQQFYTMADSMIVGRFVGEEALAAIGASYALTNVFICIAIGGGVLQAILEYTGVLSNVTGQNAWEV